MAEIETASSALMFSQSESKSGKLDLNKVASQLAQFMEVDTAKDESIVNDKIQSVLSRVEEFKHQLDHMQQNVTAVTDDVKALHENVVFLKELFEKIDQVEAFVFLVSRRVDALEESVSKTEKSMDPGKLRKMFTSLPGVFSRKAKKPVQVESDFERPAMLNAHEYFSPQGGTEVPLSPDPR